MTKTHTRARGFTLVELLVTIALIAGLAGLSSVFIPRAIRQAKQTKVTMAMKQMSSAFTAYATDHSNRLPPPVTKSSDSEAKVETYWFMYLEQQVAGGELEKYTTDSYWKGQNRSIFVNNMHPVKDLKRTSTGFAMNVLLAKNVALSRGEELDPEEYPYTTVNLATIKAPEKCAIVMPHWSYSYKCDQIESTNKRFAPYAVREKLPVLFLDGHIDPLTPKEYAKKKLDRYPAPETVE